MDRRRSFAMLDEEVKVGFHEMVAFQQRQKQMREGDI